MKIVSKKLTELVKEDNNIRRHSPAQIAEYVRSVNMFGQIRPIVIDENNKIIAGNGLFEALQQAGYEKAECYMVAGLTEQQKKKLMLADNKIYELGYTDIDVFQEVVQSLDDFDVPGWDANLLEMLTASTKEVNRAVTSYGTVEEHDEKKPPAEEAKDIVAEHTTGDNSYYETEKADVERYIICPHCGERIAL